MEDDIPDRKASPRSLPPWADHPLRARVLGEVHARPYRRAHPPQVFLHYAFHTPSDALKADFAWVSDWCRSHGVAPPDADAKVHTLGLPGGSLRWEQHSEFVSYSFDATPAPGAPPFAPLADDPFGRSFRAPGALMAAVRVDVVDEGTDPAGLLKMLDEASVCAELVFGGKAFVATDFRPDRDGVVRIVVQNRGLTVRRLGSLVQAMIEIEIYRVFALLGLPKAVDQTPAVRDIEKRTVGVLENIKSAKGLSDNRQLLEQLSELAAEAEALIAASSFRFGASRAYNEIVEDRLIGLGEAAFEGWPTIASFLNRRLQPAMRTCRAMERRQRDLSDKLARAANLLRTRVEVELEEQNSELLHSMNQRAKQQLMLQQTVEGLSVAAVSYYVISLIKYLAETVVLFGHEIDPGLVAAFAVIPVVAIVFVLVRSIRNRHGS